MLNKINSTLLPGQVSLPETRVESRMLAALQVLSGSLPSSSPWVPSDPSEIAPGWPALPPPRAGSVHRMPRAPHRTLDHAALLTAPHTGPHRSALATRLLRFGDVCAGTQDCRVPIPYACSRSRERTDSGWIHPLDWLLLALCRGLDRE